MKIVRGDLLQRAVDGEFDVIVHGCNCFCRMGSGIALTIKHRFPQAWAADLATAAGDRAKLGTFSHAEVMQGHVRFTVVNAYTQFRWGRERMHADYDAIRRAMRAVAQRYDGLRIGYPKIGAGLAGGDWSVISRVLDEELAGQDHTLVEFVEPPRAGP